MRGLRGSRGAGVSPVEELSKRGWEVLRAIIAAHLQDGQPVGSLAVARVSREGLSAATIRSVMAELEGRGLLHQPHASAGRVPTEMAWRLYADAVLDLTERREPSAPEKEQIARALAGTHGEIPAVMEEASRLLSELSHHVGVVVAPAFGRVVMERIDLVRLEGRRVLVLIVDPAGVVSHRTVEVSEEIAQETLDRMARMLVERFAGLPLAETRRRLESLMAEEKARYDGLLAQALRIAASCLSDQPALDAAGVFVGGASNILGRPDFTSAEEMRELLRALEERSRLVEILCRCLEGTGVWVRIGSENDDPRLRHCSVLAAPYSVGGRVLGAVALIGPTRMPYARAIPLVEAFSSALGRAIGKEGGPS